MADLQPLTAEHADQVRAFEVANRAFFATSISDRGDDYFDRFEERHRELLDDQERGGGAYFVLVDRDAVVGRFNLVFGEDATAVLGYRVAESAAGHGVATAGVAAVCRLAAERFAVRTVRAAVADTNAASRRVLAKTGFTPVGLADPAAIGGKAGRWYERRTPGTSAARAHG